jgi:hypothetical protein
LDGESAVDWLNRAVDTGATFGAPLTHFKYTDRNTGDPREKEVVNLLKAHPGV